MEEVEEMMPRLQAEYEHTYIAVYQWLKASFFYIKNNVQEVEE
jgi:hypothetical protein